MDTDFFELVVLSSTVVDFLLLVKDDAVIEVEEDGNDLCEVDDTEAAFYKRVFLNVNG